MVEITVAPQVASEHYEFSSYVAAPRWNSYYHQVDAVLTSGAKSALYIGVGDNVVPAVLEALKVEVKRFDFDSSLKPDYVGDIRHIADVVPSGIVDAVVCCQVLEHIPLADFEQAISQLCKLPKKTLIISLPYSHVRLLSLRISIPKFRTIRFDLLLPKFWRRWRFDGQHHWEVGALGLSKHSIEGMISRHGSIIRKFHASENGYHIFYVVEV